MRFGPRSATMAGWKPAEEGQMEKRLLRLAFEGWLPDEFRWRGKEQFGDGSGASSVLKERMEQSVSEAELAEHLGNLDPRTTIGRFATT